MKATTEPRRAADARAVLAIRRVSTAAVAALAIGAFTLSYDALHALASSHGTSAALAALWPLVVDGFIVTASLAVLHAVLEGRRTAYPWCLVLLFSAVSVVGNLAHGSPSLVGHLVAAVPPVALVLAFDLLMREVRWSIEFRSLAAARPPADRDVRPAAALEPAGQFRRAAGSADERVDGLVAMRLAAGGRVTGRWLAGELQVSDSYARRLLRARASAGAGS